MNIPESMNLIDTVVSEKTTYVIVKRLRQQRSMTRANLNVDKATAFLNKTNGL